MPKVTVILTSFNHEKYLREAIDSVLNQTFTDFELIIWDDASTDDSWKIIQSYRDSRINQFRNDVQRRGIYGINRAISEIARGEYIAIHHSDDVWELDKLEKQVKNLELRFEVGAVFTWVQFIDENGVTQENDWFDKDNKSQWRWLNDFFNMRNHLAHPSVLVRKSVYDKVGKYRNVNGQTGDAEMWSRLLIYFPIHVIPEKLTKHRWFSDKSNSSGGRMDVAIRIGNEWNNLRENFLEIDDFEDLVDIFPAMARFKNINGYNIKFLLAMVCLYDCTDRAAWRLGLSWLYELLNNSEKAELIEKLYSFTYQDFIKLTGTVDATAIGELQKCYAENDAALLARNVLVVERDAVLSERDAVVVERDVALSVRDAVVVERDAALSERDAVVVERDAALSERDAVVVERDAALSELLLFFQSKSWRITKPLRALASLTRSLKKILNLFLQNGLNLFTFRRLKSGLILLKNWNFEGLESALAVVPRNRPKRSRDDSLTEIITGRQLLQGQPLVSVIIPCFNYGRFVVEAIDSILAQTLKNVEIIVVDGGSTDITTIETLKGIVKPRTQILFREDRHLVGDNRNYGIEKADGRYICCLDADDTLDHTYLEKAVFNLETYGYDIVSTATNFVGAKQGHIDILEFPDLTDMVRGNHVLTCAVFRRELWELAGGYFDIGVGKHHVAEDWDFWLRLSAAGARIRNISGEYLFNYRIHEGGSLSSAADVKSIEDQRSAILDRNKELLTAEAYKLSAKQQLKLKFLQCDPSRNALIQSFSAPPPADGQKTLLLAIPFTLVGGAERLLSELCLYLAGHNWRIVVIATLPQDPSFGSSIDWFRKSSSEVYSLPNFLKPNEFADFINYLLASRKPDCLLNAGSRLVYELLPSIKINYPSLSVVDLLFNTIGHVESHSEFLKYISFALAENKDVHDWYVDVACWPADRVKTVSSGVDLERFCPTGRSKELVEKYGIARDELVVGFSGRLSDEKAPDVFVEIAKLCQCIPNLRFIMTGTGPMAATVSKEVRSLPPSIRFEFAGLVDDVDQYLGLYDVLVLPSRFDGRPLVVMEALACGVAVVASNVGGLPDLIENGKNGYLVAAANAKEFAAQIQILAMDRALVARLKIGARHSAEARLDAIQAHRAYDIALREAIEINDAAFTH